MTRIRRFLLAWTTVCIAAFCVMRLAAETTLCRKTSPFTTIVVTEDDRGLRTLRFGDERARQSVGKPGDPDHVELRYARAMTAALAALDREPRRMLIVGLGGGTIPTLLHKHYPETAIDVVDIDPVVAEVAKEYFGFREDALLKVSIDDGRRFIERCRRPYDVIFLDAYGEDSIPYDLATIEFLRAVRRAVKPDGVVAANVWSSQCNPLHDDMLRTYQEAFDDLCLIDVPESGNRIFLALPRKAAFDRDALAGRAARISKEKNLRFDLGEIVALGFQHVQAINAGARVLRDRDKPRGTESMPEPSPH